MSEPQAILMASARDTKVCGLRLVGDGTAWASGSGRTTTDSIIRGT